MAEIETQVSTQNEKAVDAGTVEASNDFASLLLKEFQPKSEYAEKYISQ
jgi:hypothetical protein